MKTLKRVLDEVAAVKKAAELMDIEHDMNVPYHTIVAIDQRWEEFLKKAIMANWTIDELSIVEGLRNAYLDMADDQPNDISYE